MDKDERTRLFQVFCSLIKSREQTTLDSGVEEQSVSLIEKCVRLKSLNKKIVIDFENITLNHHNDTFCDPIKSDF